MLELGTTMNGKLPDTLPPFSTFRRCKSRDGARLEHKLLGWVDLLSAR